MELPEGKKVILFDGVCNLCNGAVNWIIRRDARDTFRFAPLQGEVGQALTLDEINQRPVTGEVQRIYIGARGKAPRLRSRS